jgi:hypothetical protein
MKAEFEPIPIPERTVILKMSETDAKALYTVFNWGTSILNAVNRGDSHPELIKALDYLSYDNEAHSIYHALKPLVGR